MKLREFAWGIGLDYAWAFSTRAGYLREPTPPEALSEGTARPVLLIPGVYEPWRYLLTIGRRLHAAGHPVHALPELGYNVMPIAETAALAQRYLDENDLRGVAIVGHSKGGIVGKHMMAFDDVEHRIDRMVAISSPFSGSTRAKYVPVRPLRPFLPTDALLGSLAANLELNSRITSIFTEVDHVIPNGSVLAGATNVEVPLVGHFRLLSDPRVLDMVESAVGVD
ncbi:MAG: alpha/beta hydrolase [Actinobacteria bacterium]|nr:alpha/beta hydrolase [Actinomycetota bacterium]